MVLINLCRNSLTILPFVNFKLSLINSLGCEYVCFCFFFSIIIIIWYSVLWAPTLYTYHFGFGMNLWNEIKLETNLITTNSIRNCFGWRGQRNKKKSKSFLHKFNFIKIDRSFTFHLNFSANGSAPVKWHSKMMTYFSNDSQFLFYAK